MLEDLKEKLEVAKQFVADNTLGDVARIACTGVLGWGYYARNSWYTPDADDNFQRASDEAKAYVGITDKVDKAFDEVRANGGKATGFGSAVEDNVAIAQGMPVNDKPVSPKTVPTESGGGSTPTAPTTPVTEAPKETKSNPIRNMPIFGDIEDTGLQHTDTAVKSGVDDLNTWIFKNFGKDAEVSGGWRSPEHNASLKGASPTSLHMAGRAVDIDLSNFSREQINAIEQHAKDIGFDEVLFHDAGTGMHLHVGMSGNTGNLKSTNWDAFSPLSNIMLAESKTTDKYGISKDFIRQFDEQERANAREEERRKSLATFGDGFFNQFDHSLLGGLLKSTKAGDDYTFNEDDQKFVIDHLNGDEAGQNWIYRNAHSRQELERLVEDRLADMERAKRLEASDFFSLSTLGSVMGFGVGELTNPTNYIGVGLASKGNLALRALKAGAINATINVTDSALREKLTGYEENYKWSMLAGALAGSVMTVAGHLLSRGADDTIKNLAGKSAMVGENAKAIVSGLDSADVMLQGEKRLKAVRSLANKFYDDLAPELKGAIDNGSAIVVARKKAKTLGRLIGAEVSESVKVLDVNGVKVYFDDAVKGLDSKGVKKLTQGALGLEKVNATDKAKLLGVAESKIANPDATWQEAITRATVDGRKPTTEQVLGAYAELIENNGTNKGFRDIRNLVRKIYDDRNMSNVDVINALKRNAQAVTDTQTPFLRSPDGSVVVGGLKMSPTNALNPAPLADLTETISEAGKLFGFKVPDSVSRFTKWATGWGDDNILNRTPTGMARNSKSKTMRNIMFKIVKDAQQRAGDITTGDGLSADVLKEYILNHVSNFRYDMKKDMRNYLLSTGKLTNGQAKIDAWEKVVRYHDYKYAKCGVCPPDMPDALKRIADNLHKVETSEVDLAKQFKYLPENWKGAGGTRRVTNVEKWRNYINSFDDTLDEAGNVVKSKVVKAEESLNKYAKQAMLLKRADNEAVYRDMLAEQLEKKMSAYKEALDHWKAKGSLPESKPIEPKLQPFKEDEFMAWVDKEAHHFAYGQIDRGKSALLTDLKHITNDEPAIQRKVHENLPWLHQRTIMDTSFEMPLTNGKTFSFDTDLRDYDFDFILDHSSNRWAGEVALHDTLNNRGGFIQIATERGEKPVLEVSTETVRGILIREGKELVSLGVITENRRLKELAVFDETIALLRGVNHKDPTNVLDVVSQVVRNMSYAKNGGNMGLNQVMEMGGAMGYTGLKQLTSILPFGREFMQKVILGDADYNNASKAVLKMFGQDVRDLLWVNANLANSEIGRHLDHFGVMNTMAIGALEGLDKASNIASEITSSVNMLGKLTARMTTDIKKFAFIDLMKFARGEEVGSLLRVPLSKNKLAVIGITDKEGFRRELAQFLTKDGGLNLNKMEKTAPSLYMKCYNFMDSASKRAITEDMLGNRNMTADKNWFLRCLYQFKKFTFMATNTQAFRIMNSRERDDVMAMAYSAFMTAGVVTGLAYANGYAKYGYDTAKRDRYIEQRTNPKALASATLLRSSIFGSPLSPINDINEAGNFGWFGDTGTVRTTVNRDFRQQRKDMQPSDLFANVVSQLPALQQIDDIKKSGEAVYNSARYGLNEKDLKTLSRLVPANNFAGVQAMLQEMIHSANLPAKRGK